MKNEWYVTNFGCFTNKIPYHTQEFSERLNKQFHGYRVDLFFRKQYFQKCKKAEKMKKLWCIKKNVLNINSIQTFFWFLNYFFVFWLCETNVVKIYNMVDFFRFLFYPEVLKILTESHFWFAVYYVGHSFDTVRSRSGSDVSDVRRNFLYKRTCQKTHTQFFLDFFYFIFLKYWEKKITTF